MNMTGSESDDDASFEEKNVPSLERPLSLNAVAGSSPAVHAMLHSGLSMRNMKVLVQALGCVEQTIAAGQSILQRLTPDRDSVTDIHVITAGTAFAEKAAGQLVAAALEHGSGLKRNNEKNSDSSSNSSFLPCSG